MDEVAKTILPDETVEQYERSIEKSLYQLELTAKRLINNLKTYYGEEINGTKTRD